METKKNSRRQQIYVPTELEVVMIIGLNLKAWEVVHAIEETKARLEKARQN